MKHLARTKATKYDTDSAVVCSLPVTFIQHCRTSACLPLSPCPPSVIFPPPSNRPTLSRSVLILAHISLDLMQFTLMSLVAQAACTAPESCLSRHLSGSPGFASGVSRGVVLWYEATSLLFTYVVPKPLIRYDTTAIRLSFRWSNYWNHMFELLKVEKIIIFSKNLCVRIIRASELIEDIR